MRQARIATIVLALLFALPSGGKAQLTAPSASSFGLAGSFSARARGYEAPYWNPANLALPSAPNWSLGIVGANSALNNNSLSYNQITDLYGEYIDRETKSKLLSDIRRAGTEQFQLGGELGASALAASIWRFGFGLSALGVSDMQVSPDAAELILFGNVGEGGSGKDFDLSGDGDGSAFSNFYVSYAQPFSFSSLEGVQFSVGASVKYGIAHGLALVADDGSTFTADPLVLDTEMEIISSTDSDVGRIWAFDFGAAMDWGRSGRFLPTIWNCWAGRCASNGAAACRRAHKRTCSAGCHCVWASPLISHKWRWPADWACSSVACTSTPRTVLSRWARATVP